jgi:hypothetical protein
MPVTLPKFSGAIQGRHLGRKSPTPDMKRRALPLRPFLKRMGAKPPPDTLDYTAKGVKTLQQMLGNDQYGDCTIAAVLHQAGVHTAEQPGGVERVPTSQEAVTQYSAICGPGDQGCYVPDVMDAWRDRGLMVGGKAVKSDGYVSLALGDELLAKVALYLFGPLHFGINLPNDWYQNASPGFVWDVTTSRIVGGHSIAIPGYTTAGFKVSTWGAVGSMTFAAFHRPEWVEEIYATLSPDWYNAAGLDEHGVNVQALKDALAAIKAGGTPDIPDDPTPTPPVPPTPPTPPAPPTPHELSYTFTLFGYALRIYAGYEIATAGMMARRVDYWQLTKDVWAFGVALEKSDWAGVTNAAMAILTDLGIALSPSRVESLVRGLQARHETEPLVAPRQDSTVAHPPMYG